MMQRETLPAALPRQPNLRDCLLRAISDLISTSVARTVYHANWCRDLHYYMTYWVRRAHHVLSRIDGDRGVDGTRDSGAVDLSP